jgi:hypothetical protein
VQPYVRYLILCQDVVAEANGRTVSLIRLFTRIHAKAGETFPLGRRRICVYAQVSGCRGDRRFGVAIRETTTDRLIKPLTLQLVYADDDPLTIVQMKFDLRDITFPAPGVYAFELWCEDELLSEQTLHVGIGQ